MKKITPFSEFSAVFVANTSKTAMKNKNNRDFYYLTKILWEFLRFSPKFSNHGKKIKSSG